MDPTLEETAARINRMFRGYGLTHDVVEVDRTQLLARIVLIGAVNRGTMHNLATTLEYVFSTVPEGHGQLRLF